MSQSGPARARSRMPALIALGVIALIAMTPFLDAVYWVGSRDVEFDFLVVDGKTGAALPNATIHLRHEFHEDQNQVLHTGADGHASVIRTCKSAGRANGYWNTSMSVDLIPWSFTVTAAGYQNQLRTSLLDYGQKIQHGQGRSLLPVRVGLTKSPKLPI